MSALMTISEASDALRVCRKTIYNMRDRGLIRFVKVCNKSLVPKEDVDQFTNPPQRIPVGENRTG
jgi:excisionase family DNA binding protein